MAIKIFTMVRLITPIYETIRTFISKLSQEINKEGEQQPNKAVKYPRFTMVAVVGAAHVHGICECLTNTTIINTEPEDVLPQLLTTRRWENDTDVQHEMIDDWVNGLAIMHVTEPSVN